MGAAMLVGWFCECPILTRREPQELDPTERRWTFKSTFIPIHTLADDV